MKVSELIDFLKTQPQELTVVYCCYSEQCMLDAESIKIEELGLEREDGWVHNPRPDKPTKKYLVFPGN